MGRVDFALPMGPRLPDLFNFLLDVAYLYESLSGKQSLTQDSLGKWKDGRGLDAVQGFVF
jgi:hypothetical protein